ncbi:MAG: hypothetical protein MK110_04650 [Fuerstiella sp.]|nr:hypothetical protein [Fuerstiella sp.]
MKRTLQKPSRNTVLLCRPEIDWWRIVDGGLPSGAEQEWIPGFELHCVRSESNHDVFTELTQTV